MLDAGADHDVVDAGGDQRRTEVHGLLRRSALAVDGGRGGLDRQPGLQPGVARDVPGLLADLLHAPGDHVLDLGGVDARPLDDLREARPEQLVGMRVLVIALLRVTAPDRRANSLDDHDLTALLCAHADRLRYAPDWRVNSGEDDVGEKLGIAGSGAIATGLAACATRTPGASAVGAVRRVRLARDEGDRQGVRAPRRGLRRRQHHRHDRPRRPAQRDVPRRGDRRGHRSEERAAGPARGPASDDAVISTTTSSLSVSELAAATGRPERFVGLHVFNPVPRMKLVELAYPRGGDRGDPRASHRALHRAGQGAGRRSRSRGLRRQPAALPLSLQRRGLHGGDRLAAGLDRYLHAARRGPSDGPDRPAGLHRPRRLGGDRGRDRRQRARSRCATSAPTARWGARAAADCIRPSSTCAEDPFRARSAWGSTIAVRLHLAPPPRST